MCKVLGVPRSTYYKSLDNIESKRKLENDRLKTEIKMIYSDSKGIYGAPKIHYILTKRGFQVSLKRVQRKMRELGLRSITFKKHKPYSHKKAKDASENVLKQDFTAISINQKWVGDITYIHTLQDGWCYLASVLDLYSKKIIGYSFGEEMKDELVIRALKNAYSTQKINKENTLIFYTDLGSQYTSNDMKILCDEFNILQSFSRKGCPYDNACIESFHAIIKKEEVYTTKYITFEDAKIAIFKYIES